ncbi:MAG: 2-oxoglutarate dehydrogenase complex dihydrolipoyllysine-residue succinyltransferase, partial [Bacteroidota bacterium]
LPSEATGTLEIIAEAGTTLAVGDLICKITVMEGVPAESSSPAPSSSETTTTSTPVASQEQTYATGHASPAAAKILAEKGIDPKDVKGTGVDGRITKEDAEKAQKPATTKPSTPAKKQESPKPTPPKTTVPGSREQSRKRMSQMRKTIARRLVAVKNDTAMLTTFNEVNMKPIMDLRKRFKEEFKEKYGVGLGFMSFFSKACAIALQSFPGVNAQIDENEIVYHDYVDISVAVSTDRGLVVPVLRNVEGMSFYDVEAGIVELAVKARDGKLTIDEMTGGTFTITNGGIFGSMMSTPIINAPQSAILGMHNIVQRPMAVNGEVVILPMMYLALSYDHRIIDGKEAVSFLVTVKKYLEEPERLMFGV